MRTIYSYNSLIIVIIWSIMYQIFMYLMFLTVISAWGQIDPKGPPMYTKHVQASENITVQISCLLCLPFKWGKAKKSKLWILWCLTLRVVKMTPRITGRLNQEPYLDPTVTVTCADPGSLAHLTVATLHFYACYPPNLVPSHNMSTCSLMSREFHSSLIKGIGLLTRS